MRSVHSFVSVSDAVGNCLRRETRYVPWDSKYVTIMAVARVGGSCHCALSISPSLAIV